MRALFKQRGVRLASVVENVDESVSGELVENIIASISQFFSANLGEETKKGMRQMVLQGGWPHRPPRGYVTVRNPDQSSTAIDIHPREGPLIRRAFELFGSGGYSVRAIAKRLARDGLVSRSGGPIPTSYICRILTNEFYVGRVVWRDLNVEGRHPALVPDKLFAKVQAIVRERHRSPIRRMPVNRLPLRRLAICATCRGRMSGEWHDRWGYYRCGRQAYRRDRCASRMCNAEKVHSDLRRLLLRLQIPTSAASAIQKAADRILAERSASARAGTVQDENERSQLTVMESRLTDAFAAGDLSAEVFRTKTAEIRARRASLEDNAKRATLDPHDASVRIARTLSMATSLWDLYERFDPEKQAEFLEAVFTTLVLSHEGLVGHSLKEPFGRLLKAGLAAETTGRERQQAEALVDAEFAA
jgi:hypothetical protein